MSHGLNKKNVSLLLADFALIAIVCTCLFVGRDFIDNGFYVRNSGSVESFSQLPLDIGREFNGLKTSGVIGYKSTDLARVKGLELSVELDKASFENLESRLNSNHGVSVVDGDSVIVLSGQTSTDFTVSGFYYIDQSRLEISLGK